MPKVAKVSPKDGKNQVGGLPGLLAAMPNMVAAPNVGTNVLASGPGNFNSQNGGRLKPANPPPPPPKR